MKNNKLLEVNKELEIIEFSEKYSGFAGFLIKSGQNITLNLKNISFINEMVFNVEKDAFLKVNFVADDKPTNLKISADLEQNAKITFNLIDFSYENKNINCVVNLNGENASGYWNTSCLNMNNFIKKFNISFIHNAKSTLSNLSFYGVATDKSNIIVDGVSHIKKDCSKSNAKQTAKIILYNEKCKAKACPLLKIDNEDISASHGFVVGTLNEDHMFYLLSRGIAEKEAKNLITYGYLKPVLDVFNEQEKENLINLLGERI